jgi:hypothetical protein
MHKQASFTVYPYSFCAYFIELFTDYMPKEATNRRSWKPHKNEDIERLLNIQSLASQPEKNSLFKMG